MGRDRRLRQTETGCSRWRSRVLLSSLARGDSMPDRLPTSQPLAAGVTPRSDRAEGGPRRQLRATHGGRPLRAPRFMWVMAGVAVRRRRERSARSRCWSRTRTSFDDGALWINHRASPTLASALCFVGARRWPVLARSTRRSRSADRGRHPRRLSAATTRAASTRFFYVWIGLYAAFFFSRRVALLYLAAIAARLGGLLVAEDVDAALGAVGDDGRDDRPGGVPDRPAGPPGAPGRARVDLDRARARRADGDPGRGRAHRRPHRAAQPPRLGRGARARARARRARRDPALHRDRRPRPVQGLQRRPRPPGRRPAAEAARRRLARRAADDRRARALRRGGVRARAARMRPRATPGPWSSACAPRPRPSRRRPRGS